LSYYLVTDEQGKEPERLVLAPNQSQAIRHCAKRYTAKVASTHEVATILLNGGQVESAEVSEPGVA
jgi:hypothetical protein